ncbi:transposase [Bradyrhizobium sp. ma5]|uniref:transposase n=1 Tax=Bradyrhizobium sp. ma5 TaxID=3344828 RepID=UPI0035D4D352
MRAKDQALGRSRGGLTIKIHLLADALGRPLRIIVTAGQANDITQGPALLGGQSGDALIADKAYDSNALRAIIAKIGAAAVIPSNHTRRIINSARRRRLQTAQPHRALLLPPQTLPTLGDPL